MLKNIKAVIFDLDGTLIDSMGIWRDIDIEFLSQRNISFEEDLQTKIEGMSFTETAVFFREYYQLSESIDELKDIWNKMAEHKYRYEIQPKSGALRFLEYLKKKGIKMGIATSNSEELIAAVNEAYHFDTYMSCIVTSCSVNKGKPAPDVYLEAARQLKVAPENCLVFEDIVKGIQAGKNAGMKVCAIEDTYSAHQREEKKHISDYYINSYEEILQ
ncbi:MAG: HAD family phosphatase, partial [Lachnospiraceae bacterium]|nr:HAD family phosphatase [Lachnospiraceae bacterium]